MSDYIDRDVLIARIRGTGYHDQIKSNLLFIANMIPAADVQSVKHAKWISPTRVPDSILSECSGCGFDTGAYTFNFCPNCGASMKED